MVNVKSLDFSQSDNWNVAKDYSSLKIMKFLYLADEYEIIATFGASQLTEEILTSEELKLEARINALNRLAKMLEMILNNTEFAVLSKDKKEIEDLRKSLTALMPLLPYIESRNYNQQTKKTSLRVNEKLFKQILDILMIIKRELNEPLNRANLIFREREEWDPEKFKQETIDELVETG